MDKGGILYSMLNPLEVEVAETTNISLSNATLPYIRSIASNGVAKTISADHNLAKGVNTLCGQITHPALAESLSMAYGGPKELLS